MGPCIYNVPSQIREGKPDAYTPRMVLIGLLHRSQLPKLKDGEDDGKKNQKKGSADDSKKNKKKASDEDDAETSQKASEDAAEKTKRTGHLKGKTRKLYETMENVKRTYLGHFTARVGEDSVTEMKKIIQTEEENIRGSYAVKYEKMTSDFFVELILLDSVFIIEFIRRLQECRGTSGDEIVDKPSQTEIVIGDLLLLENQLPYLIFHKLFGPHMMSICIHKTLDRLILELFSLHTKIKTSPNFNHFTDMYRCVYQESLDRDPKLNDLNGPAIAEMMNADNLSLAGVEFKAVSLLNSSKQDGIHCQSSRNQQKLDLLPISIRNNEADEYSLHMEFKKGCLVMSSFRVDDTCDKILRNVIAYEQCHALPLFTSNYVHFINFLLTTDKDVEILAEAGVLKKDMGRPSLALEMVNKLKIGLIASDTSQYHSVAVNLRAHYKSRTKRYWATLWKVYFSDLWKGTATIVAVLLLFLTLVGTVASVIQAYLSLYPVQKPKS